MPHVRPILSALCLSTALIGCYGIVIPGSGELPDGENVFSRELLQRSFSLEGGSWVSPDLFTETAVDRVSVLMVYQDKHGPMPFAAEVRGLNAAGRHGAWIPLSTTHFETNFRAAAADLGTEAVAAQLRLSDDTVHALATAEWLGRPVGPLSNGTSISMPSPSQEALVADNLWEAGNLQLYGIHTRAEWGAQAVSCSNAYDRDYSYMTLHHSAGAAVSSDLPAFMRSQLAHYLSIGWCDMMYDFYIDANGDIWQGRILRHRGAHNSGKIYPGGTTVYGNDTIGIGMLGCHDSSACGSLESYPSAAKLEAVARTMAAAADVYRLTLDRSHLLGHREFDLSATLGGTACPGDTIMGEFSNIVVRAREILANDFVDPEPPAPSVRTGNGPQGQYVPLADPSFFNAGTSTRLIDTRQSGIIQGGTFNTIDAGDAAGGGAEALALQMTVVLPGANGHLTVVPSATGLGTSTLNFPANRVATSNGSIGYLNRGAIHYYLSTTAHVVADTQGWYGETGAGLKTVALTRLYDSRSEGGSIPAGGVRKLGLSPPAGAVAAVLGITAVGASATGFLTAFACSGTSTPVPDISFLNYAGDDTVAASGVVPLGADVCIYSHAATHVVVDLQGWYASSSSLGYVPLNPSRLLDTRSTAGEWSGALAPEQTVDVDVRAVSGMPANIENVALNVTLANAGGPGYVKIYPCGSSTITSNINYAPGHTRAALAHVNVDSTGKVCFWSKETGHLIVDLLGAYQPVPAPSCGDGTCNGDESCSSCTQDCGACPVVCGDGACAAPESCNSCPVDCGTCPLSCGDGECNGSEDCTSCATDCGACPPVCGDGECNGTEDCASCELDCGACPAGCGDDTCDPDETCADCAADCGACPAVCGDGSCTGAETCSSCAEDCGSCGSCGDASCDGGETCSFCPDDCGTCPVSCGDGRCNDAESCDTCPADCGACDPVCGDGSCGANEACGDCPEDCSECPGGALRSSCAATPSSSHAAVCLLLLGGRAVRRRRRHHAPA